MASENQVNFIASDEVLCILEQFKGTRGKLSDYINQAIVHYEKRKSADEPRLSSLILWLMAKDPKTKIEKELSAVLQEFMENLSSVEEPPRKKRSRR